jgi:hypothetical protein
MNLHTLLGKLNAITKKIRTLIQEKTSKKDLLKRYFLKRDEHFTHSPGHQFF